MTIDWKRRVTLFVQRFWQPTSACMTCMPGSWTYVMSTEHWLVALRTGLATGVLALLLTFTPAARLYGNRYGNALVVAVLTMFGDAYSHPSHYGTSITEPLLTGVVSGVFALVASFLLERRAYRVRAVWTQLLGKRHA